MFKFFNKPTSGRRRAVLSMCRVSYCSSFLIGGTEGVGSKEWAVVSVGSARCLQPKSSESVFTQTSDLCRFKEKTEVRVRSHVTCSACAAAIIICSYISPVSGFCCKHTWTCRRRTDGRKEGDDTFSTSWFRKVWHVKTEAETELSDISSEWLWHTMK